MSEKDIKTKPKISPKVNEKANIPKVAVKSKDAVVNTVKDAKAVMKDTLVKKAIETKLGAEQEQSQPQKADTEAAESVESAAYTTADTVYHKGKTFTQNKIREHRANKVKSKEEYLENNTDNLPEQKDEVQAEPNTPKTKEASEPTTEKASDNPSKVKTKDEYMKSKSEQNSQNVKTKENYIKQHSSEGEPINGVNRQKAPSQTVKTREYVNGCSEENVKPKSANEARREYVQKKVKDKKAEEKREAENVSQKEHSSPKTKEDYQGATELKGKDHNNPNGKIDTASGSEKVDLTSGIKTKENYMKTLRQERFEVEKSPYRSAPKPNQKAKTVSRSTTNAKKALKTRQSSIGKGKSVVKSGSAYTGKAAKQKTAKATKKAVKTQKEFAKKTAKEAARQAKIAAQKAAQVAKAVAVKTAKAVVAITKAIAAAVTKAAAAFFAAFGWIGVIIVLIILIVVIIVAAIAGSPFGIFLSDEAADANSIPVSSIVNECNIELSSRLTEIEDNTTHDRIVMEGEQADWGLVLSLFSVKVAGVEDDTVQDVVVIDDAKKQKLKEVFWDMHTITSRTETVTSGETSEIVLYITITAKTKDEMVSQYGFTRKQKEALETLLENADGYIGATQSLAISDATAQEVIDNLPDTLSNERKQVVKKACSLVGKLTYFWGGKSSAIGWDSEWGKMKLVTAEGSRSTGCMRPYGLDCSGFVTWSFINAGYSASAIGHGTSTQVSKGTRISWSSAQPGDLAFYNDTSHVGIIGGRDSNGNILVIHCSSGANNVVITTGGFGFAVRPNCY